MSKRKITVPIEITIHEPTENSFPIFLLEGGGQYTTTSHAEPLQFGSAGASMVAYLPQQYAVSLDFETLIKAGLKAIGLPVN